MRTKVSIFLTWFLLICGVGGILVVLQDLIKQGPIKDLLSYLTPPLSLALYFLISIPIASMWMLFSKEKWKKIVGVLFLLGTILMLYVIDQALV